LFKGGLRCVRQILILALGATISLAISPIPSAASSTPSVVTVLAFSTGPAAATIEGEINPAGQETHYQVAYSAASSAWCKIQPPGPPEHTTPLEAFAFADTASHTVAVKLTGLAQGGEYCAEITAENGSGTGHGGQKFFVFGGPKAITLGARPAGTTTAIVEGKVNPASQETRYYVTFAVASSLWCKYPFLAQPEHSTAPEKLAFSDATFHAVNSRVSGLGPGTEYCGELVATNPSGTEVGEQTRFTTMHTSASALTASLGTFTARAVPVPEIGGGSWPHTGNFLGANAAIEFEIAVEGSGYGVTARNPTGGIPPISQVNVYFPVGLRVHPQPFARCTPGTLKQVGSSGCPKTSFASPTESLPSEVTFGEERVPEQSQLQAFVGEGGLLFDESGRTPVPVEAVWRGHYATPPPPYGEELMNEIPAVVTAPGGALRSLHKIHITLGAALRKGKKLISYFNLPTKCSNGLPFKTEVTFGGEPGFARTLTGEYHAPCPKKLKARPPSAMQIAALLSEELVPSGKLARISALLKHNGYGRAIKALEAGTVTIAWYRGPRGATLTSKGKRKSVLVASGRHVFAEPGSATIKIRLTSAGRRLLKHAKQLRLIARGTFTPVAQPPVAVLRRFTVRR
jgi:hypothetical protein